MAGHVYLIGSPTFRWYKIGKSSDATIRVSELGILLPFRIEVIAVWKTAMYNQLERDLHEKYAANRINGEWFSFTTEEVDTLCKEMLWASTNAAIGFQNLEKDYAPDGKVLKIKFKKHAAPMWNKHPMTPEQCEARKQDSIDWQRLKKQKSEITLEEYTKRRDELIARRKSQHAKWAAAAKLLDIKTESA